MICKNCGSEFNEGLNLCPNCGAPVGEEFDGFNEQEIVTDTNDVGGLSESEEKSLSTKGVIAIVCAGVSWLLSCLPIISWLSFPLAIAAIVLGFIVVSKTKKLNLQGKVKTAKTLGLVSIILGFALFAFVVIGFVVGIILGGVIGVSPALFGALGSMF